MVVAKYFCKVNYTRGQFRVTVPKAVIKALGWGDVEYVILERKPLGRILMRRFVDGKDLKNNRKTNPPGPNR